MMVSNNGGHILKRFNMWAHYDNILQHKTDEEIIRINAKIMAIIEEEMLEDDEN